MGEKARQDWETYLRARRVLEVAGGSLNGQRILDLGCGHRFQIALLFATFYCQASGIDLYVAHQGPLLRRYRRIWIDAGARMVARTALRDAIGRDRKYYAFLQSYAGRQLAFDRVDAQRMSATAMTFPDRYFDACVSFNVIEHITDVPHVVDELHRVLKPNSLALMRIHLFPSLSGGHHPYWLERSGYIGVRGEQRETIAGRSEQSVPPWDHLRQSRYPSPDYVNHMCKEQYLTIFARRFEVMACEHTIEGEELLTHEIETSLCPPYTREDLLTRDVTLLLRRVK